VAFTAKDKKDDADDHDGKKRNGLRSGSRNKIVKVGRREGRAAEFQCEHDKCNQTFHSERAFNRHVASHSGDDKNKVDDDEEEEEEDKRNRLNGIDIGKDMT